MRSIAATFPLSRPRRLRATPMVRDLVRENHLSAKDFIWPLFVRDGGGAPEPVASMPGVFRHSVEGIVESARRAADLGIPAIAIFPNTPDALKTPDAAEAWNPDNLANRATRAVKAAVPEVAVMLDVALDPYNSDGHDGIVQNGEVLNDESLIALEKQALAHAEAGADILGPSDMMDGRVGIIRGSLENSDFTKTLIMSYTAKYASGFYGPFRDAVGSGGALKGDKKTYQMDPGNTDEALKEAAMDIAEGADMIMVKPGMPYLDIASRIKREFGIPTFAYQVSGEYAMLTAAAQNGWLEREAVMLESLMAFKRAGCDGILTYFAQEAAEALAGQ